MSSPCSQLTCSKNPQKTHQKKSRSRERQIAVISNETIDCNYCFYDWTSHCKKMVEIYVIGSNNQIEEIWKLIQIYSRLNSDDAYIDAGFAMINDINPWLSIPIKDDCWASCITEMLQRKTNSPQIQNIWNHLEYHSYKFTIDQTTLASHVINLSLTTSNLNSSLFKYLPKNQIQSLNLNNDKNNVDVSVMNELLPVMTKVEELTFNNINCWNLLNWNQSKLPSLKKLSLEGSSGKKFSFNQLSNQFPYLTSFSLTSPGILLDNGFKYLEVLYMNQIEPSDFNKLSTVLKQLSSLTNLSFNISFGCKNKPKNIIEMTQNFLDIVFALQLTSLRMDFHRCLNDNCATQIIKNAIPCVFQSISKISHFICLDIANIKMDKTYKNLIWPTCLKQLSINQIDDECVSSFFNSNIVHLTILNINNHLKDLFQKHNILKGY
jgi:hypothetical protein